MAEQRTSLDKQIAAVNAVARRTGDLALEDALQTLCQLKRVENALQGEEPDTEEVIKHLEKLLISEN